MFSLSLTRLIAQKFRLISTSISVFIGVAFLAGSMVLIDTLGDSFDELATDVNRGVDVVVRSSEVIESGFAQVRGQIDEDLLAVVSGVDGVAEAQANVDGFAQLVDAQGDAVGNPGQGAPTIGANWSDSETLNQVIIAEGRSPQAPDEIAIDRYTAENNGFSIGDEVTVLLQVPPEQFTITGIGTFGESDSLMGASLTMFELSTAQRVLGAEGMLTSISVAAESGVSQDELRDRI